MVSGRMTDTPTPGHPAELSALSLPDRYLRPGTLQLGAPPPLSVYVHRSEEHTSELQSH